MSAAALCANLLSQVCEDRDEWEQVIERAERRYEAIGRGLVVVRALLIICRKERILVGYIPVYTGYIRYITLMT